MAVASGMAAIADVHAWSLMANVPARNASHNPIVHTAIRLPYAVPTGGATEMRYLNAPNVISHPWLKVSRLGIT